MYVAYPSDVGLDTTDLDEVLAVALRIQLQRLGVRFHLRIQATATLEDTVMHYVSAAQFERSPEEQASHGAVWASRQLRDDIIVQVAFKQHADGAVISYARLHALFVRQLAATSVAHLGTMLEPDDPRAQMPLVEYFPTPPGVPAPFWVGAYWGMPRYHRLCCLALEARRNGCDILESWVEFQLSK
jgi:hypothetical protein